MKTISVIPLKKGLFKEDLTYFSIKDIPNGSIVNIMVRNKKILGLTTSSIDVSDIKSKIKGMNFNLKKIEEVKGKSVFRGEFLESIILASKYFVSNKSYSVVNLLPSTFKNEYDQISKIKNETSNDTTLKSDKTTNIKSEKLLFQASYEERISYYKTLIRESFARKKSIFIVLPTEHDIKNFREMLSRGIESFLFSLHGGLSTKKQLEQYEKIIISSHPIVILGTAPFLFIPRYDIETIILEKENSNAYRTMGAIHIDLRILVEIFSVKIGAKLIESDTILRFETIARKNKDDFGEINPMSFRTNFDGEIEITGKNIQDVEQGKTKKFKVLNDNTIKEIKEYISKDKNIFVFSLRKGLATLTVCKDCSDPVLCEKCMAPIVLYLSRDNTKRMFVCNKCKNEKSPETKCENCGSWNLIPLGIGTDTVFEELKNILPENKIFKLDKESAKTAKQAEKIIADFEKSRGAILIGTEMTFFYLKEKIPLTVIASFDSLWSIPNFKMSEKIIHILLSIISKTEKKLIIETKNRSDPAILAVKQENLLSFIREELEDRRALGYPPYKRFIKITHTGDKEQSINAKRILREFLEKFNPEIFSGFITKQKNKYVTNALIKIEPKNWSLPELSVDSQINPELFEKLISLQNNFSINVDPEDLL